MFLPLTQMTAKSVKYIYSLSLIYQGLTVQLPTTSFYNFWRIAHGFQFFKFRQTIPDFLSTAWFIHFSHVTLIFLDYRGLFVCFCFCVFSLSSYIRASILLLLLAGPGLTFPWICYIQNITTTQSMLRVLH